MASDLGNGKIDGTALILNFDILNPANWLWGKQYDVYTHVDTDAERYLKFEKWWGDFIQLNGDELQFLVDNLFIGDKLTRNQLQSHNGTVFDLRSITSPIIVFTSTEDNISPPPQTLGWIVDLYRDVDDIRATGRTIVYCVNQEIGHLAIFVSSKVGAKEDEEFVQLMDVIDCLPPGLYEMVISPRPANVPAAGFVTGDWIARFEARSLDDIRALGRNSPEDDRAFAAVARLSEVNLSIYRTFMQPFVRAFASQPMADLAQAMNPLRLSYTIFGDKNPWMKGMQPLAAAVSAARKPVAADNPLLALQTKVFGANHVRSGCLSRRARQTGGADVLRLLRLAVRPSTSRHQRRQHRAAGAGNVAGNAGGATSPDGCLRGDAEDRRVRRSADPGGALRPRSQSDARPALRTRVERCAPAAHAIFRSPSSKSWCGTNSSSSSLSQSER